MSLDANLSLVMKVAKSWGSTKESVAELAVVPLLKVLCMGALGTILAHPRIDVIKPLTTTLLSKLVFTLFLPCLIFTELGAIITFQNLLEWWFIPVNVILSSVIGCVVGFLVAIICRPPPKFVRFTIVMTGVGNTGNIPLAIIGAICHRNNTPFGPNCNQIGVAYVSFSTWISAIIVYTFVYHMLEPPDFEDVDGALEPGLGNTDGEEKELLIDVASDNVTETMPDDVTEARPAHPSVLEAEWPGLEAAHNENFRIPVLKQIWFQSPLISHHSLTSDDHYGSSRLLCIKEPRVVQKIRKVAERTPLEHILQPPTIASILAIAVGLFPRAKGVVFGVGAPLAFLDDSFEILACAMVPCIMLVLGGTLSVGPARSELGLKTTIVICFTRLFVLPAIGIGVVTLAGNLGCFPQDDNMFKFVLLLHHAMPTAILCGAMASLRGHGEREASSLIFWQHTVAVFSVALYIAIYLSLLSYT